MSAFFIACYFSSLSGHAGNQLPDSCPNLTDIDKTRLKSATVRWIADGDTLHSHQGHKLRLLHINSPELNPKSDKPAEAFAAEARSALETLAKPGETIYWINDTKARDRYGRELALVFNQQGRLINAQMLLAGMAHVLVIPPNDKYWQCSIETQAIAREKGKGIWQNLNPVPVADITPKNGWQLVTGKLNRMTQTDQQILLELDGHFVVKVNKPVHNALKNTLEKLSSGDSLILWTYPYRSRGQLSGQLRHPAMLVDVQKQKPR